MAKKDNTVKSFILRVDADMMEAIEAWLQDEFRSTNGQIQYILDQALRKAGRLKKKRLPCHKTTTSHKKSLIFRSGFFING